MMANDAISRLTEREKEALRAWLDHKTAKEIALELGVSHHAVEKRLKMARTKLGTANSVEAARMLARAEGYDRPVPQGADLDPSQRLGNTWRSRPFVIGAITMSMLVAAASLYLSHSAASGIAMKPGDLLLVAPTTFEQLDQNGSGFLEGEEAPLLIRASGDPAYTPHANGIAELASDEIQIDTTYLRDGFYQQADTNRDGKISRAEYADWEKPAERLATTAAEKRIAKVTRRTFDFVDADKSGFLERPETPMVGSAILEEVTPTAEGVAAIHEAKLASSPSPAELEQFYSEADSDRDGRISFAEYHQWAIPRLAEMGYDLANAMKPES